MTTNLYLDEYIQLQKKNPFSSTSTLAYESLLNLILRGDLASGTVLRQTDLADQFGLSRSPIREAMSRLIKEGYVEKTNQGCTRVYTFNSRDYSVLVQFRLLLETSAIQYAAFNMEEKDFATLKRSLDELQAAAVINDRDAALAADELFHLTIVNASKNTYIIDTYHHYLRKIRFYRNILSAKQSFSSTYRFHERIYKAFLSRDIETAEKYMKRHLEISKGVSDSIK